MPLKIGSLEIDLSGSSTREVSHELIFERSAIDVESRTVDLSFSSETPVIREDSRGNPYWEVLCHSKVDMSRMKEGSPLLWGHDKKAHLGSVVTARICPDKIGRAKVRFGRGAIASEKFADVQDGILRCVSVGGDLTNAEPIEEGMREGIPVIRFRNWTPLEITLTPLPADTRVGIGRSLQTKNQSHTMTPEQQAAADAAAAQAAASATASTVTTTVNRDAQAAAQRETHRMSEISSIGARFKVPPERVIQALTTNEPLDMFRDFVMKEHLKADPVTISPNIGMNRTEKRRYSMQRAIQRVGSRQPLDGLEKEVSDACAKQYRREADVNGFLIPHDVSDFSDREMVAAMFRVNPSMRNTPWGQNMERALFAGVFPAAGALVAEEFLGGSFIELLRNKTLLTQLGVGTLSGLVGNVAIPRQSGAATAYWLAEGDSVTATDQAFAQVAATPRRLAAQTAFTKQLLAQASLDAEAIIRDDLMRVLAIAKDLAGIQGTGGKQPLGILNGPLTGSGTAPNILGQVTFGAAPTWPNVVAFENAIETGNADIGTMQWLSNPTVKNKWKTTVKVANYPVFLIGDDNRAAGYPMNVTNQIGTSGTYANRAIFGAWGQAMFCDWAGMDVVVDPYTQAASNKIVVTLNLFTDFIVRHWPSFAISTDSGAQ